MQPYPHHYVVRASGSGSGLIGLRSNGLPDLASAAPAEFDGPGDQWSPETLLCAAVADCLLLTWRAVSRASRYEWTAIDCEVSGELDRVEGVARFVAFTTKVTLSVAAGADAERARALLEKSERACLITNSLNARHTLDIRIVAAA